MASIAQLQARELTSKLEEIYTELLKLNDKLWMLAVRESPDRITFVKAFRMTAIAVNAVAVAKSELEEVEGGDGR